MSDDKDEEDEKELQKVLKEIKDYHFSAGKINDTRWIRGPDFYENEKEE